MRVPGGRTLLVAVCALSVGAVGTILLGWVAHAGPFAPEPWRNVKSGAVAGPGYDGLWAPYESSDCIGFSISWRRAAYVPRPAKPEAEYSGTYVATATLPSTAVFTGWERGDKRLWINPTEEMAPGTYRYLYVVSASDHHVERWPRAMFGCM